MVGIVVTLVSILPMAFAAHWYDRTGSFLKEAVKTRATVVEVEERHSDEGPMYHPVFSFTDREGNVHRIRSSLGENPPGYRVGDTIHVYYDPTNPGKNKLDRFVTLWLGPVLLAVMGIFFLMFGGLIFLVGPVIVRSVRGTTPGMESGSEAVTHSEEAFPHADGSEGEQNRTWAMLTHMTALSLLAGIPFGNILAPLFIWLWKRRASPLVDANGKESLNFQISITLYGILSLVSCLVLIGFVLLAALAIADLVLVILASLRADKGGLYRYPLTLRFIR